MLKRVLFRAAAVVAALGLGAGSAKADFIIDDFLNPNPTTGFVTVTGQPGNQVTRTDNLTSQGTPTRVLTVTETNNGGGNTQFRVGQVAPGAGRLTLGTVDSTANIQAQYTYGSGQNLSAGGTSLQFTFATADFGVPYSVQLTSGSGASAVTATQSGTTTTGAGVYAFDTSAFTGAGFDLTNITGVLLSLNLNLSGSSTTPPVTSADFSLSDVRVLTPDAPPPPAVPAPPAAVLLLAAVPLLGLARARRILPV